MSWVNFSSCCNAQLPLLNKRQHNVHRGNLHMLQFRTKKTNQKQRFGSPSVSSKQHHEAPCLLHTYGKYTLWNISICTVCELDDYTFIFMCSAVIQIAREHHSREKRFSPFFHAKEYFLKKKDEYVTAKASLVIGKKN